MFVEVEVEGVLDSGETKRSVYRIAEDWAKSPEEAIQYVRDSREYAAGFAEVTRLDIRVDDHRRTAGIVHCRTHGLWQWCVFMFGSARFKSRRQARRYCQANNIVVRYERDRAADGFKDVLRSIREFVNSPYEKLYTIDGVMVDWARNCLVDKFNKLAEMPVGDRKIADSVLSFLAWTLEKPWRGVGASEPMSWLLLRNTFSFPWYLDRISPARRLRIADTAMTLWHMGTSSDCQRKVGDLPGKVDEMMRGGA